MLTSRRGPQRFWVEQKGSAATKRLRTTALNGNSRLLSSQIANALENERDILIQVQKRELELPPYNTQANRIKTIPPERQEVKLRPYKTQTDEWN